MCESEYKILLSLIEEYELRAKYNDDARDYATYSMLLKVKTLVEKEMEGQQA